MTITRSILLLSILATAACGGKRASPGALPEDPAAAVTAFLDAVKAEDMPAMGDLWGSSRGPANTWMKGDELHQRLSVMQVVLAHDSFAVQPGTMPATSAEERVVRVRITRGNCQPVVPFTVRQYRDRWIVSDIDLAAAGNPARPCPPGATRGAPR